MGFGLSGYALWSAGCAPRSPWALNYVNEIERAEANFADLIKVPSRLLGSQVGTMRSMLPTGFQWIPRGQYSGDELALKLDGRCIAQLMRKVDGLTWLAQLDCHQPITETIVMRPCTSFEAGKAGIEAWAVRHEATLKAGRCVYHQEAEE